MYEIIEKSYFPNRKDGLMVVSFGLPCHDWYELQKLKCWEQVTEFLSQKGSLGNRNRHIKEKG